MPRAAVSEAPGGGVWLTRPAAQASLTRPAISGRMSKPPTRVPTRWRKRSTAWSVTATVMPSFNARSPAAVRGLEQQVLEADERRLVELADTPHGEQHPRHERLARVGVLADRQRLADVAEDDLLMSDEARQPN